VKIFSLLQSFRTGCGAKFTLLFNAYREFFHMGKVVGASSWPATSSNIEVKKEQRFTCTSPYAFTAFTGKTFACSPANCVYGSINLNRFTSNNMWPKETRTTTFSIPISSYYLLTYLLTPWSRVLLEKLTSELCS
jgi:hypothetical protein